MVADHITAVAIGLQVESQPRRALGDSLRSATTTGPTSPSPNASLLCCDMTRLRLQSRRHSCSHVGRRGYSFRSGGTGAHGSPALPVAGLHHRSPKATGNTQRSRCLRRGERHGPRQRLAPGTQGAAHARRCLLVLAGCGWLAPAREHAHKRASGASGARAHQRACPAHVRAGIFARFSLEGAQSVTARGGKVA
jgi:hypothetical protein